MTIVLYYGESGEWDASRDLYGLLGIEENQREYLIPYISNYKINLIEPAKLEDLSCYKTDLQQVFGMLKYRKDKEKLIDYINKNKDYFSNLTEESYDAIKVFLKSEKIIKDIRKDDKTGGTVQVAAEKLGIPVAEPSSLDQ